MATTNIESDPNMSLVPAGYHECGGMECEKEGKLRCKGCKNAWYCSPACQKFAWTFHIFDCKAKGTIRTAHHLARACRQDLMPTDAQTLRDYGFERICDPEAVSKLLGLYQGLFILHKYRLEPRELDKWLREGTLAQHIKDTFEAVPAHTRGGYYPWFLENQWVLDPSVPVPEGSGVEALGERMEAKLWDTLGPERKAEHDAGRWPRESIVCMVIYRFLLSGLHPSPISSSEEYIGFGFCTADDMYEEMQIARIYTTLMGRCTFEEFCKAYETNGLIALMKAKGITTGVTKHFEHVVTGLGHGARESVWDLKQFVYGDGERRIIPSITCDYGFMNCRTPSEREELLVVYKAAFEGRGFDAMELHAECIKGHVYEYVLKFQKFSKEEKRKFVRLMKNPYPLPEY